MKKVSDKELIKYIEEYKQAEPNDDILGRVFMLACYILIDFFKPTWVLKRVLGEGGEGKYLPFLNRSNTPEVAFKHQDRVIALAEICFNLQNVKGLDKRLADLERSTDVEAAIGELEGARFLYTSKIPFAFKNPCGEKGLDYDVDIEYADEIIPCEMKCKLEKTNPGDKAISSVLAKARKQLTSDRAGIVFIKLPESWTKEPEVKDLIMNSLTKGFNDCGRIGMVVFHWEIWQFNPDGSALRTVMYRTEINQACRFDLTNIRLLENSLKNTDFNNWLFLLKLVIDSVSKK